MAPAPERKPSKPQWIVGLLFWGAAGFALQALPQSLRGAAAQLLTLPVVAFAWKGGPVTGTWHGMLAGASALLAGAPLPEATVVGSLGGLPGVLTTTLLGAVTGLLSRRLSRHLQRRRDSEERYVLAARGANDGLWDWDLETDRVYYSERWCEILGYQPGDIAGRPEDWLDRVHPSDASRVRAQIDDHLKDHSVRLESEHRIRRQDGSWAWVLTRGLCTRSGTGVPRRITGWMTDVSEHKRAEERLRHFAFHDALTGLPNRALFMDRVEHALARLHRHPERKLAVFVLDLDRFKNVNDSIGHQAGDELLCQVARRLETCVRDGDTIARLGGDEFTILMEDVRTTDEAERMASLIQRSIAAPIRLGGEDVASAASIGVVLAGVDAPDPLSLLRDADQAMYHAKRLGKGRHVVFDAGEHHEVSQRLSLEAALRMALDERSIFVEYQPIVDLSSGEILGFEAFARWHHPELGAISPREFIGLAEETALIDRLDRLVLEQAIAALSEWNHLRGTREPFALGVNVSMSELFEEQWLEQVRAQMERYDVEPHQLRIEVTEHDLMQNADAGPEMLRRLRQSGIQVHLDDFGTGYSSLSYLHRFPLDGLKIDGTFVRDLHQGRGSEEIVRAVVNLARDLDLQVTAEGAERATHVEVLRTLGCHAAQGFFFGAPKGRAEISALVRSNPSWHPEPLTVAEER